MSISTRLTATAARQEQDPFEVPIAPGTTVLVRRPPLETLLLMGAIPLHLVEAYDKLARIAQGAGDDPSRLFLALSLEEKQDFLDLLRRYAVEAVIDPPLTLTSDPARPDAIGIVGHPLFDVSQLTAIFNARPPGAVVVPSGAAADAFPDGAARDAGPPIPGGEDLRPAAVPVVADDGRASLNGRRDLRAERRPRGAVHRA